MQFVKCGAISFKGLKKLWKMKIKGEKMPRNWKKSILKYLELKKRFYEMKKGKVNDWWIVTYDEALQIAKNLGVDVSVYEIG